MKLLLTIKALKTFKFNPVSIKQTNELIGNPDNFDRIHMISTWFDGILSLLDKTATSETKMLQNLNKMVD